MTETAQTPTTIKLRVKELVNNKVAQGIVGTMLLKVCSAVVAFALFSLAARAAGLEEFGYFSIVFSAVSMLSIVAAAGQELQIVRCWNEYLSENRPGLAIGALRFGWLVTLSGALIIGLLLWVLFDKGLETANISVPHQWTMHAAAVSFLIVNTLCLYSAHATRAIVGIRMGDANYELTWRSIAIVFLAACLWTGRPVQMIEIFTVFTVGLVLVVVTQAWSIVRQVKVEIGNVKPLYKLREWSGRSARLWLAAAMESANQHMEVFLIGMLLDPIAAGAYFVAARLANAFALATGGLYTFATRRVPKLYFSRDIPALKHTLHLMAITTLLIVVCGMSVVLLAGDYMLMIFGSAYADYYWVLVILAIGTALTAANGAAPSFLMLTGHEGRYMVIVTISVILRVVGFFLVVPTYGILGAATVTMVVMVGMALLLNVYCRVLTGMDPSILRFFIESPDEPPAGFKPSEELAESPRP
ncbi:polysaccharide biosynthesis C-terminal domain-containing protein [uncultured Cohaesibacter sp.]|uniref:lipopolysaccharide biosynthesis protein n=1 Tax=uncultured Cohaesibacter sp. TaxID=1002546 RepID=UPI0029C8B43B|nr:polysaccharide biosynthesis C-terminal domain-containing protein [uncultured Cohaesibacter sp.]